LGLPRFAYVALQMLVTGRYGASQINDSSSLPLVLDTSERAVELC